MYLKGLIVAALVLASFFWIFYTQNEGPIYRHQVVDELETDGIKDFQSVDFLRKKPFQLSQLQDKIIILNFWATWCEPCAKEIPDLVKLVEEFKGQVALVAVSVDEEEAELTAFLKAFGGLSQDHVYVVRDAEQKVAKVYGVNIFPESFIFTPDGKLARKVVGFVDWFNESSVVYMKQLLKKR